MGGTQYLKSLQPINETRNLKHHASVANFNSINSKSSIQGYDSFLKNGLTKQKVMKLDGNLKKSSFLGNLAATQQHLQEKLESP